MPRRTDTDAVTTGGSVVTSPVSRLYFPSTTFDPVDYGAVYDGSTDDSAAINAAIDACTAVGGGIVEVRATGGLNSSARRVKISNDVIVKDGVWLRGVGATTTFAGAGAIRIPGSGVTLADRMMISDFTFQSPTAAAAIDLDNIGGTGGLQLGWPRITVQNVTIVDPVGYGFRVTLGIVIEARFINCVVMRPTTTGFLIGDSDNFLIGCTVGGALSGGGNPGFNIGSGNNKLTACKAYGLTGFGFTLSGAGRYMLSSCEAQDCGAGGFSLLSGNNSLAACLADTCGNYGFYIDSNTNTVDGVVLGPGGGGTNATTEVGVFITPGHYGNRVNAAIKESTLVKVAGGLDSNSVNIDGMDGSQALTYAATITPDPTIGSTMTLTLTGNTTIKAPAIAIPGHSMHFLFRQDATGGRVVTFAGGYRTTAAWAPTNTAGTVDGITFVYDGTRWVQTSVALAVTDVTAMTDSFNRADGALGTADTGQAWSTSDGKMVIVGNQAAAPTASAFTQKTFGWLEAGRSDATVQATMVSSLAMLVFRIVDASNYYVWTDNAIAVYVAGVSKTVRWAGSSLSFTNGDVLQARCAGGTAYLYKNGTFVAAVALTYHAGATKFGVGINYTSATADLFSIT